MTSPQLYQSPVQLVNHSGVVLQTPPQQRQGQVRCEQHGLAQGSHLRSLELAEAQGIGREAVSESQDVLCRWVGAILHLARDG